MLIAVILLAAAAPQRVPPQRGDCNPLPEVQPATYASPSGEWRLEVDPSRPDGDGPSHYRMTFGGTEVWSRDQPFAYREAQVDDRGFVAGDTLAWDELVRGGGRYVFPILMPNGEPRVCEERLEGAPFRVQWVKEHFRGTFVHQGLDRFIVRAREGSADPCVPWLESWRVYELSSARLIERVDARAMLASQDGIECSIAALEIRGTPLTLVQWWKSVPIIGPLYEDGARFVVCDANWRPVWTLEWAHDYERDPDSDWWSRPSTQFLREGALIERDGPGRFAIRHWGANEDVEFAAIEDAAAPYGWRIDETGRRPFERVEPQRLAPTRLRKISTVPIHVKAASTLVRDIEAFDVDADGGVRFIRGERGNHVFTLVSLDPRGQRRSELALAPLAPEIDGLVRWTPLTGGDWLAALDPSSSEPGSTTWRVDGGTGVAQPLTALAGVVVLCGAGTRDGGFVVAGEVRSAQSVRAVLRRCDSEAKPLWELVGITAPLCLALTPDQSTVTLFERGGRTRMQRSGAGGAPSPEVELHTEFQESPFRVNGVVVDADGTVLVDADPWSRDELYRWSQSGERLPSRPFQRYGMSIELHSRIAWRLDPLGRLWGADRAHIFRLGASGSCEQLIQSEPNAEDIMERVGWAQFDDRALVGFEDTEANGVRLFGLDGSPAALRAVARDGSREDGRERLLDGGWWLGSRDAAVQKLNQLGSPVLRVERRPDGRFFEQIWGIGSGKDGTLAVVDARGLDGQRGFDVSTFTPAGKPVSTVHVAGRDGMTGCREVTVGKRWILVSGSLECAYLISLSGGPPLMIELPLSARRWPVAKFGFSPDEKELWCAEYSGPTLHRFALPE